MLDTTRGSGKSKLILQLWSCALVAAQISTVPFCIKTNHSVCVHTEGGIQLSTRIVASTMLTCTSGP